jgi:hypothetical protein
MLNLVGQQAKYWYIPTNCPAQSVFLHNNNIFIISIIVLSKKKWNYGINMPLPSKQKSKGVNASTVCVLMVSCKRQCQCDPWSLDKML